MSDPWANTKQPSVEAIAGAYKRELDAMSMTRKQFNAVLGWRQAVSIIEDQQRALDWCVAKFADMKSDGLLMEAESTAREYHDVVMRARKVGSDYVAAMRQDGASN